MSKIHELAFNAEEIDELLDSVDKKTIYQDATQSEHGLMSATDKTKLDALPTAQQIDGALDAKVDKEAGKGLSKNDYTDADKAKVASALQSETDPTVPSWAKQQNKPTYTASEIGAIPTSEKGVAAGVATLNSQGKIPVSQLPSYVDDVLEYANLAAFPATGESGKIYVAFDTNKTYRWGGSSYVEISPSLALGETSSTAFAGNRGKAIEDKIPSNASSSNKLATMDDLPEVTTDYDDFTNKPQINSVTLSGNKSASDLGLATAAQGAKADTAYQKPQSGIPSTDLTSGVQASLDKADTAVQQVIVGTTTTGAAGTNASVTNRGTSTAPVLDFTIPRGADGQNGQDGADAVNPFKGWYETLAKLKAAHTAIEGDSAYVKDASPATTWSIYVYDSTASSDNYWADSDTDADTSNVQTFASGEEVNEVHIVNDFLTGGANNVFSAEAGRNLAVNTPINVNENGFYIVDQNLNIGLAFVNGELIVPSKYFGKKLSVLGDSISTFGTPDQNNATGLWTYPGNRCRYPKNDLLTNVDYCWWKKLLDKTGMVLGINESWAGSRVSNTQSTDSGDLGPNRCISSLTRIGHLDDNGVPDIIIVYAGTNDIGHSVTIGTFDTTSPQNLTEEQIAALDVTTFASAYRAMLIRLQYYYRSSRIIVCLPNFTSTYYNTENLDLYLEVIKEECDYFGVEVIDLRDSGITMFNRTLYLPDGVHPNPNGMELLFENIYNYLINN